jgi:Ni,Fe-hydrogenase maturation factor
LVTKDNAAGVLVVRALSNRKRALDTIHLLIVDAAEIDETPGTVKWIPEESIDGMSASTHSLTLSMLAVI